MLQERQQSRTTISEIIRHPIKTWRTLREHRQAPEVEEKHQRVSVLVTRLNDVNNVLDPLIPTERTIDFFRNRGWYPLENMYTTTSMWLLKGHESPAAGQVQLVGGRVKTRNGIPEGPEVAAAREIREEVHVFSVDPKKIRYLYQWQRSFHHHNYPSEIAIRVTDKQAKKQKKPHTKVNYDETVLVTEAPYFQIPYAFYARDKVDKVIQLTPIEVDTLLRENRLDIQVNGTSTIYLQDCLSDDEGLRAHQQVSTDGSEALIRPMLSFETNYFETRMRMKLIEKLLANTSARRKYQLIQTWNRRLSDFFEGNSDFAIESAGFRTGQVQINTVSWATLRKLTKESLETLSAITWQMIPTVEEALSSEGIELDRATDVLSQDTIDALLKDGSENLLQTNIMKRVKLVRELRYAYQNLAFERNIPFLENTGTQKPFLLAQNLLQMDRLTPTEYQLLSNSTELKDIFGLVCEVFEVDTARHPLWYEELGKRMTTYRTLRENAALNLLPKGSNQYEAIREALYNGFANRFKIHKPWINYYLRQAWKFSSGFMDDELRPVADESVRRLLTDSSIPYRSALDLDILLSDICDPQRTIEEKWTAMRTILLSLAYKKAEDIQSDSINTIDPDPMGVVFSKMTQKALGQEELFPRQKFNRFELAFRSDIKEIFKSQGRNQQIDLGRIPAEILTYWRSKDVFSIMRKSLERGSPKEGMGIDDFFGRQILLDTSRFWEELTKVYPQLFFASEQERHAIVEAWHVDMMKKFVYFYEQAFYIMGYEYQRDKVRDEGFENIITHQDHAGSGATKVKEYYRWIKFVHTAKLDGTRKSSEELQILPIEEAIKKKKQDPEYYSDRLFAVSNTRPLYVPITNALYFPQRAYPDLVKRKRREVVVYPSP